ncbi:Major Facilitator Superfamily transporter [Marinitoga piezophila KA3]|uniref:Major Facilitator Superfamily transporter n=1 Tax=Marinitoga piezophila (strain DSM 14283 / JCM 11233 / KA3) TaxID=443254 RepID=H2J7G6_MARPK|nr:MFS transporter [Marinitoga piezophila]AEX86459.1 Major Facilitator Superfamily transporter [Marinitoga piezophila KA3]
MNNIYILSFIISIFISFLGDMSYNFFWYYTILKDHPVIGLGAFGTLTLFTSLVSFIFIQRFFKNTSIISFYYKINIFKAILVFLNIVFFVQIKPPYNYLLTVVLYFLMTVSGTIIAGTVNSIISTILKDKNEFTRFSSLNATLMRIALLSGWPLAGIIDKFGGVKWLLAFDFITFIPLIVVTLNLEKKIPELKEITYSSRFTRKNKRNNREDLKPFLRVLTEVFAVYVVSSFTTMTTIVLWKHNNLAEQIDSLSTSIFFTAFNGGMLLSSTLLMTRRIAEYYTKNVLRLRNIILIFTAACTYLSVVFSNNYLGFIIVMFFYGLSAGFILPTYRILINNYFEKEKKHILFAYNGIISRYSGSIANLIAAFIISVYSVNYVYYFSAIGLMLIVVVNILLNNNFYLNSFEEKMSIEYEE